jgi:hypothetical protein
VGLLSPISGIILQARKEVEGGAVQIRAEGSQWGCEVGIGQEIRDG